MSSATLLRQIPSLLHRDPAEEAGALPSRLGRPFGESCPQRARNRSEVSHPVAKMDHMRNERGMSGSVQVSLLLPVALGIFLLLLQWSLVAWADATALAAAQQGAASAAALGGDRLEGQAEAAAVAGNGALSGVTVRVERGSRQTRATVSGRAVSLIWPREVSQTVVVTTERLTNS